MYEFEAVSVSSYEAGSLAAKLTEKSNEGWDVVAIVPAGSDVTAYLKRSAGGSESTTSSVSTPDAEAAVESVVNSSSAPAEPAGWGSAPSSTTPDRGATSTGGWGSNTGTDSSTTSGWGSTSTPAASGGWGSTASTPASPVTPTQPAQPATPTVAADWYADPAGRYELRYWNGTAWTEHVSRNGQQFTDPPVA